MPNCQILQLSRILAVGGIMTILLILLISPLCYRLTHIVLIRVAFQFLSVLLQVGFYYCIVQR